MTKNSKGSFCSWNTLYIDITGFSFVLLQKPLLQISKCQK